MMIERAIRRLIERGWLRVEDVGAPEFHVADRSSRIECFEIAAPRGRGVVWKRGLDAPGRAAVAHEWRLLRSLCRQPGTPALRRALPSPIGFDRSAGALVTRRIDGAVPLDQESADGQATRATTIEELGRAI